MQGKILGGRYQITSHLGGGGFGTTFLAVDKHLPGNPRCVVKQLKPQTATNPLALQVARRLFNREAEVLYHLGSHPQIPRLFAHFEQEEEFYLVQEFIEGHELRQEVSAGKQLAEIEVVALLREILEILAFVHQENVIHRDIKPSNLIRRQKDNKLVLIDFGAVKQFSNQVIDSEGHTSLTIVVGSLGYMPNEQMAGKPRFCSDIYALGIIGIQALTGLSPKQLPEDPRTSEIVWRNFVEVGSELADVLDKMVRYDFRQRYQSVSEVLEAINSIPLTLLNTTIKTNTRNEEIDISTIPTQTILAEELNSECGIDYQKLRDLLAAGKWKEADLETGDLILKLCGREEEGWIKNEDIEKIPCQDLRAIDQLWVKYSNGRFGFSLQKQIYEELKASDNYQKDIWRNLGDRLGWRRQETWLYYDGFTFNLDAAVGHFPAYGFLWIWPDEIAECLFSRIEVCKLNQPSIVSSKINSESSNNKKDLTELNKLEDLLERGNTLYEQEKYQQAIAIYKKAISLEKNYYLAWFMLGKTFNKCNLLEKELFSYKKAIEIKPDYQEAWFMQAMALEKLERNEEAIASYDRVVEIQPNHFWAWRERGKILEKLQRYKEAADSYQRAIIIKPDFQLAIEGRKRSLNKISSNQSKFLIVNVDNINSAWRKDEDGNRQTSVKTRIAIVEGDITKQRVDAIVNATDLWFSGGGGVDRAIHLAAGPQLRQECNQLIGKGWATGEAEITNGYNLAAKWIIHTVGPIWRGGNHQEEQKLAQCYTNCLALAEQNSIKTIAFPAISTGAFGFPIELATKIAVSEVKFFLERHYSIEKVIFVCFGKTAYDCYLNAVKEGE